MSNFSLGVCGNMAIEAMMDIKSLELDVKQSQDYDQFLGRSPWLERCGRKVICEGFVFEHFDRKEAGQYYQLKIVEDKKGPIELYMGKEKHIYWYLVDDPTDGSNGGMYPYLEEALKDVFPELNDKPMRVDVCFGGEWLNRLRIKMRSLA